MHKGAVAACRPVLELSSWRAPGAPVAAPAARAHAWDTSWRHMGPNRWPMHLVNVDTPLHAPSAQLPPLLPPVPALPGCLWASPAVSCAWARPASSIRTPVAAARQSVPPPLKSRLGARPSPKLAHPAQRASRQSGPCATRPRLAAHHIRAPGSQRRRRRPPAATAAATAAEPPRAGSPSLGLPHTNERPARGPRRRACGRCRRRSQAAETQRALPRVLDGPGRRRPRGRTWPR